MASTPLYHQTKTPINFWYRWRLNLKSLIQLSETLPVELIGTHTFAVFGYFILREINAENGVNLFEYCHIYIYILWGQRIWEPRSILISGSRPRSMREKRPRMNKEGPKLLGGIADDRHVLGELVPWKEKAAHHPKQPSQSSQTKGPTRGDSYRGMVEEQLQKRLSPLH